MTYRERPTGSPRKTAGMVVGMLSLLSLILAVGFLVDTPRRMQSDERFRQQKIVPAIEFLHGFRARHQRYPSENEFEGWKAGQGWDGRALSVYYDRVPETVPAPDREVAPDAFVLSTWRGDGFESYDSATGQYWPRPWGWRDGFLHFAAGLAAAAALGAMTWVLRRKG